MSDNGGPIYEPGAANNWPLRGGKYSDWQGGQKTNAFVSGGYIPSASRSTTHHGVVSIADWYATFASLAGVDPTDERAKAAGLPAIDSRDQWDAIVGTNHSTVRDDALHLSSAAVLKWPFKLVTGKQPYTAWTSPTYPNCSTVRNVTDGKDGPGFADFKVFNVPMKFETETLSDRILWVYDCGYAPGCLFDLSKDPTEHHDLAGDPAYVDVVSHLVEKLAEMNRTIYDPDRGNMSIDACEVAIRNGGFLGPFVDVPDDWYTPVPEPSAAKRLENEALRDVLKDVDKRMTSLAEVFQHDVYHEFVEYEMKRFDKCLS